MRACWQAWRRRQPSKILYVPVPTFGSSIVAAGLRRSHRIVSGVQMLEVRR